MEKITLNRIMHQKGLTMSQLARKLRVPAACVRQWVCGSSLPQVAQIKQMAVVLEESEETMFATFKPQTLAKKAKEDGKELSMLFRRLFRHIESSQELVDLFFFFSIGRSHGIIAARDDRAFAFTKVHACLNGNAVIFADESDNLVVLTTQTIEEVRPVSMGYNVFIVIVT